MSRTDAGMPKGPLPSARKSRADQASTVLAADPQGKVVIVLHGLFKTRSSMDEVSKYLAEKGGYSVLNISYSSTRADIAANAKSLASIVEHLEGVEEIDFVVHSLGSLIVRHYLGDQIDAESGRKPDPPDRKLHCDVGAPESWHFIRRPTVGRQQIVQRHVSIRRGRYG